jgi:hypothetical protein
MSQTTLRLAGLMVDLLYGAVNRTVCFLGEAGFANVCREMNERSGWC